MVAVDRGGEVAAAGRPARRASERAGGPWPTDLAILDDPHHQALELASARMLSAGAFAGAFALADRRCRITPPPGAHNYVLRADARFRLGDRDGALLDIAMAIAIAPYDIAANRRMLAWGRGNDRDRAADVLIAGESEVRVLQAAIETLRRRGRRSFAATTVLDDSVLGWAAWTRDRTVAVTIEGSDGKTTTALSPDPFHPLAGKGWHATAFAIRRPRSSEPQTILLVATADPDNGGRRHRSVASLGTMTSENFHAVQAPPNEAAPAAARAEAAPDKAGVTVIVPVYADPAATRTCLDRLVAEAARSSRHRIIIVDDAAPGAEMASVLAGIAGARGVTVLRNPRNLGFVASVNRGLALVDGDVIILNADTVPPPGMIDRLARAAHREADIGIVTPFSNNSELTSFPAPNVANPLASIARSLRLDRIAARVNAGELCDIPSGTGFCLFVTAACRAATGTLSHSYHRGYLEDVDFCLRARRQGYRTVCDPSVFVGHAGSRSFGDEKPALVARNFAVLAERFPDYASECAAFARADPLARYRIAIEGALAGGAAPRRRSAAALPEARDRTQRIPPAQRPRRPRSSVARKQCRALGIVAASPSASGFRQMRDLALTLRRLAPELTVVVLGATLDDIGLMRIGNVFVSGAVEPEEIPSATHLYGIRALFAACPSSSPGPRVAAAAAAPLPVAWLDRRPGRGGGDNDIAVPPGCSGLELAARLHTWLAGLPS